MIVLITQAFSTITFPIYIKLAKVWIWYNEFMGYSLDNIRQRRRDGTDCMTNFH